MMLNELNTVVLNKDIPEYDLVRGDIGVIVHKYNNSSGIEVEFVSGEGRTVGVITLTISDVRPMGYGEILHVRELHSA